MSSVLLIDGHPNPESLCSALAARYAQGARSAGASVDELALRELRFDPVLHLGYRGEQPLEPDLQQAQQRIRAASHVCLVTPLWWGSVPALLKGFFDRTLQRGWAYRYKPNGMPEGLLAGRSARVLLTTDSPGWYLRLVQGSPTERQLVRSGVHLFKFWFSVGRDEQRRRFKERQVHPLKQWKLSPVDLASLDKWDDYTRAKENMFLHCDTSDAPWTVIKSNCKKRARLNAMRFVLHRLPYARKDLSRVGAVDPLIVGRPALVPGGYEDQLATSVAT